MKTHLLQFILLAASATALSLPAKGQGEGLPTAPEGLATDSILIARADSLADVTELSDFVVSARKEIIKSDGANLTYDLQQDDSSKGQNMLDALRKVPMVTVDGNDNIYIKGSSNFKILVNGKEDRMLEANAKTIFKSMPAESVSKIEVLTEPGAKYDAEGVGGILNLITERNRREQGYSGSVSAGFTTQNYYAALFGSMKYGNFNADANATYAGNDGLFQENYGEIENIDFTSSLARTQKERSEQKISFNFYNVALNMSWEPDSLNLFSWGGSWMDIGAKINRYRSDTSILSAAGDLQSQWSQLTSGGLYNSSATANASWRHNFDSFGQRIISAYAFNFGKSDINTESQTEGILNFPATLPSSSNSIVNYTREHIAQIDYSNPFHGTTHLLETGAKGVFRRNTALSFTGSTSSPTGSEAVNADQIQDIYAIYASYTGNFGKWNTRAGLRYEHTLMGMDFREGSYSNFRTHLNDFVPNLSVSYSFTPARTLRLAYQMRIYRPSIEQLNPATLTIGTQCRQGNPSLESERNNSLSLTFASYGRILGGNVTATYIRSDNNISSYSEFRDGIQYETYGNFGTRQQGELSGFLNINISPKMTLNLNGAVNYTSINDPKAKLGNHGWAGNWGLNWSYTGPGDVKFSAYGGQGSRIITLNGYFSGWYYYGISIARDFLKEKTLNVSLNAGNFLTKYTHNFSESSGPGWQTSNHWANRSWSVGINVSWRFGKLQEKAKTSGLDLSTDDKSSTGKKSGVGL